MSKPNGPANVRLEQGSDDYSVTHWHIVIMGFLQECGSMNGMVLLQREIELMLDREGVNNGFA